MVIDGCVCAPQHPAAVRRQALESAPFPPFPGYRSAHAPVRRFAIPVVLSCCCSDPAQPPRCRCRARCPGSAGPGLRARRLRQRERACRQARRRTYQSRPASLLMAAYVIYQSIHDGQAQARRSGADQRERLAHRRPRACSPRSTRAPADALLMGMVIQSGNDATVALARAHRRLRDDLRRPGMNSGRSSSAHTLALHERDRPAASGSLA